MIGFNVAFKGNTDFYRAAKEKVSGGERIEDGEFYQRVIKSLKQKLPDGIFCCPFELGKNEGEQLLFFNLSEISCLEAKEKVEQVLKDYFEDDSLLFEYREITIAEFDKMRNRYDYLYDAGRDIYRKFECGYRSCSDYIIREAIAEDYETLTLERAIENAEKIFVGDGYINELHRIFAPEHPHKFFGHPVQYKVNVRSYEAADDYCSLLISALFSVGRLLSKRVIKISELSRDAYGDSDIVNLFKNAYGATIIIDMQGVKDRDSEYAVNYEPMIESFNKILKEYEKNVLVICIERGDNPGFSKKFMASMEYADFVELSEGTGNERQAKECLERLIKNSGLSAYGADKEYEFEKGVYSLSDVYSRFKTWGSSCLQNKIYTAYTNCQLLRAETVRENKGNAYEELHSLIGLDEVKNIIDQIIACNVMDIKRKEKYADHKGMSRHMIFVGNPGTAKTTVARLLAKILKENDVLSTGAFVECSRAELVGEYVGWTAKAVKKKFKEASGGILFIDEAYSLIDGTQSYGDEAINTINAEMENNREKTIVIFAGYKDEMMEFLDKNQGLKSRITFHIEFPDYSVDELMKIFDNILETNHYSVTEKAKEKVHTILSTAVKDDNYGNGRYVRNMIEHAIMKQSYRLYTNRKEDKLFLLEAEDFEMPQREAATESRIGFCVR